MWGLFCVRKMDLKLRPRLGRARCLPLRPLANGRAAGVREQTQHSTPCEVHLSCYAFCKHAAAQPQRHAAPPEFFPRARASSRTPRASHCPDSIIMLDTRCARAPEKKSHRQRGPSKALANCTGFEQSPPLIVAASLRRAPVRRSCRGLRPWLVLRVSCVLSPHADIVIMHRVLRARVLPKDSAPPAKTVQGSGRGHGSALAAALRPLAPAPQPFAFATPSVLPLTSPLHCMCLFLVESEREREKLSLIHI